MTEWDAACLTVFEPGLSKKDYCHMYVDNSAASTLLGKAPGKLGCRNLLSLSQELILAERLGSQSALNFIPNVLDEVKSGPFLQYPDF